MIDALGIVNFEDFGVKVGGMSRYRTISAFSFLGRYRVVDFALSNMVNSGIDQIKVLVAEKPRSLIEHLGDGTQYDINPKHGSIQLLYPDSLAASNVYFHDIYMLNENIEFFKKVERKNIVIAPSYMICNLDYNDLIKSRQENGADITVGYKTVNKAKKEFLGCRTVQFDKDGKVKAIGDNVGVSNKANILMETYVMEKETFLELIQNAIKISPLYSLVDVLSVATDEFVIKGFEYDGYLACLNSLNAYYNANLDFLDEDNEEAFFTKDWPIYTRTNDSSPAHYGKNASVKNCMIANGCEINGAVENCILGRGVKIGEGAVIKNSLILPEVTIGNDCYIEYAVVDKHAQVVIAKEVIGEKEDLAYIKRRDVV